MSWYETGEVDFPLYRFILFGYMVSEQGEVIAYRFGLLRVVRDRSNSTSIGTEDWVSQDSLDEFLREYGSLVLKGTKEMLSDGSFRWRLSAVNRDMELVTEGRKALVFARDSSTTAHFYLLSEDGRFVHKGFAGGDAHKIAEGLFNGEMDIADDKFVSDKYKRYIVLGEEIARARFTGTNLSATQISDDGSLVARGLSGVGNGVNVYPSFVRGVEVTVSNLYDSKTEVLDMSKCAGLYSFQLYEYSHSLSVSSIPRLTLIFPSRLSKEVVGEKPCNISVKVSAEELKFINFPRDAIFNTLYLTGANITGIDGCIKTTDCTLRDCTGLSELSIAVSKRVAKSIKI